MLNQMEFTHDGKVVDKVEMAIRRLQAFEPKEDGYFVAFSGGKDSIASAMRFKQFGYNVYLYHMRNINPTFSDEWECAQKLADMLELPIFIDEVHFNFSNSIHLYNHFFYYFNLAHSCFSAKKQKEMAKTLHSLR